MFKYQNNIYTVVYMKKETQYKRYTWKGKVCRYAIPKKPKPLSLQDKKEESTAPGRVRPDCPNGGNSGQVVKPA
jgi:hypothetical protein